ncbi:MAG: Txe/YoeB family addiction module toxin [Spirochaetota bacterium]
MSGSRNYKLVFSRQAQKDAKRLSAAGLRPKAEELLALIAQAPYQSPPRFERPVGNLSGAFSRRISIQHRLVYEVLEKDRIVKVLRMWTHYE